MPFELKSTVPWGRTLEEYKSMFNLTNDDINKNIISFGDGPASFNFEMTQQGKSVTSIDPVYQFSENDLRNRIQEVRGIVMEQIRNNTANFVWNNIKDPDELETIRMSAMENFLSDFEKGKTEGRYINHELPQKTTFGKHGFDIGLSSHFLLLYSQLGGAFHIKAIAEMLRICREVRIFPIVNLDSKKSEVLDDVFDQFGNDYNVEIVKTAYEFQKGGNEMLVIG